MSLQQLLVLSPHYISVNLCEGCNYIDLEIFQTLPKEDMKQLLSEVGLCKKFKKSFEAYKTDAVVVDKEQVATDARGSTSPQAEVLNLPIIDAIPIEPIVDERQNEEEEGYGKRRKVFDTSSDI